MHFFSLRCVLYRLLENGGYDTNTETAWSFRDSMEFP